MVLKIETYQSFGYGVSGCSSLTYLLPLCGIHLPSPRQCTRRDTRVWASFFQGVSLPQYYWFAFSQRLHLLISNFILIGYCGRSWSHGFQQSRCNVPALGRVEQVECWRELPRDRKLYSKRSNRTSDDKLAGNWETIHANHIGNSCLRVKCSLFIILKFIYYSTVSIIYALGYDDLV